MLPYRIFQPGDQAITFSLGDVISEKYHQKIISMREWLHKNPPTWLLDIVVSYTTITMIYDLFKLKKEINDMNTFAYLSEKLETAFEHSVDTNADPVTWKIPVCYDGPFSPDLQHIASLRGITTAEIIRLHTAVSYRIFMIGFLPGFTYLASVDERIAVPRKQKPRAMVEAGSVGIAGVQTGIYPINSPGGWQIIGKTPVEIFKKNEDPPMQWNAGDRVQFHSITSEQFFELSLSLK
jgi:inhibitor of KinA